MSTVYFIHVPKNLSPEAAKKFGGLHVMLSPGEVAQENYELMGESIERQLSAFTEGDYFALCGNPLLLIMAGVALSRRIPTEDIDFLMWDRRSHEYQVKRIEHVFA